MHSLRDSHGLPSAKSALRFLGVRLASRPDTASLAPEIQQSRSEVVAAEEAHDEKHEQWLAASAVVRYLDTKLGQMVGTLARDTLSLVGGNRQDARYQRLFAKAPSEAMKGVADDPQERYVRTIIATVQEDDAYKTLRGHLPGLIASLGELKTAVAKRNDLMLANEMALRDVRLTLDKAKRAYNLMYPRLQVIFPDDPALVETFFRPLHGTGDKSHDIVAPEPGQAEPPVTVPGKGSL